MKIAIICEGRTEKAFKPCLTRFLTTRLAGKMPRIRFMDQGGAIPTKEKLRRLLHVLLNDSESSFDAVIALSDIYPAFTNADDAKLSMRDWGGSDPRFFPHVAVHDFEAWLLPYWDEIKRISKTNQNPFALNPETVNHQNPPAQRLARLFEAGKCRDSYSKPRDAARILLNADLLVSARMCAELKAFVNTILSLCDKDQIIT